MRKKADVAGRRSDEKVSNWVSNSGIVKKSGRKGEETVIDEQEVAVKLNKAEALQC